MEYSYHYIYDNVDYENMIVYVHSEVFLSNSKEERKGLECEKYIFILLRRGFKLVDRTVELKAARR